MMNDETNREERAEFLKNVLVGFDVIFFMTYFLVLASYSYQYNDYVPHTSWALELSQSNLWDWLVDKISYPLWHLGVYFCINSLEIDAAKATALVTALYQGVAFLSILGVWSMNKLDNRERSRQVFWAVCLLLVNPLYAPWFNQKYYLGQIAANTWHNPANIAVKCFAVLSFGLVAVLLQRRENASESDKRDLLVYIALSASLLLSALAKPSFLQGFLPGVGLFILIRAVLERKSFDFKFYSKLCVAFLPAVAILFFQYLITFLNAESIRAEVEVKLAWGVFFHRFTDNLTVSFLISFAFPLFVLCMNFKKLIRTEKIQLVICYEAVAWLESMLLNEAGILVDVGDFTWAGTTSALIVWITMFECYAQELYSAHEENTMRRKIFIYGGFLLFAAHLLFGITYWYNITFNGLSF